MHMVSKRIWGFFIKNIICLSIVFLGMGSTPVNASGLDPADPSSFTVPEQTIVKGVVKKGDTASSLLNRYLPLKSIYKICSTDDDTFSLARIKRGHPYTIVLENNALVRFEYEIDTEDQLVVEVNNGSFVIFETPIEYETRVETISGVIHSSLFNAVRKTGEKCELAVKLADIFAWDIDFIRDLKAEDHFKVLVEKKYRNGKLAGYGPIQAAFFTNQQTLYKAFLFHDSRGVAGYYDENGNSLQKAFLKAPLSFSRISSGFTMRRLHPIFKKYRPHPGVDYAAPMGTPIKTVGDGVVTRKGYNKGMGNFVEVRHFNGYITSYNHMSRFARGMKKNKRLVQGDVIGFVGMTGYATGPHLDFRMKKNGTLIDPLKHKSPSAKPVGPDQMARFQVKTDQLSARMVTAQAVVLTKKKST